MAFIYEVNGQRIEFDKEPTDADIDEAALSLGSSKAKPKSNMPKPVEGEGGAAFGVYRPAGRRPDSQNDREASAEMGLQTARGVASNVPALLGIPGTAINAVANAPRSAQMISNRVASVQSQLAGNERQPEPELPEYNQITPYDMNYFAQLTPGPQPTSPQGQLAFSAGQMVGAPIVPPVLKAAAPAARAGYNFARDAADLAMHPIQTAKTGMEAFGRGYASPMGTAENTALMPIRPTYYPHEQVAEFQAGTRPATQMTEAPTSDLISTPTQKWAQNMAPTNKAGQPLVAPAGRGFEGYMENLGSTYKQNPYMAAIDAATGLGGLALTGMPTPVSALSKSIPALAARTLQGATQFEPGFSAAAVQGMQGRSALEAGMPQTPLLSGPSGPVKPGPNPTISVGPTGEATTSPGQFKYNEPAPVRSTPKETAQRMAAEKLAQTQAAANAASKQKAAEMVEQINQKKQAQFEAARAQQPAGPVEPTPLPTDTAQPTTQKSPVSKATEMNDRLAKLKANLEASGHKIDAPETPLTKAELAEQEKMKNMSAAESRGHILKEWVIGNRLAEAETLDTSKSAYGAANNKTRNQVEKLMKAGIDEIPVVEGATDKQVIDALYGYIEKNKPEMFKAKRGPSKKGPSNVSKMMIDEPKGSSHYPTKEEFEKAGIFSSLKDKAHTGSYTQGDKIIHVEEINYGKLPKDVTSNWDQTKTYATDKNGNRVPVGKEWTEADPEPLSSQLKKRFKRD